jgi:hypothetical protein
MIGNECVVLLADFRLFPIITDLLPTSFRLITDSFPIEEIWCFSY